MATIAMTSDIDVVTRYNDLMRESLGTDSVYIRAKETIEELAAEGDLKDSDKAKIISEVISGLSGSLANACMSTALQWASTEKDLQLKKLKLEQELDILTQDELLKQEQVKKVKYDSIATQAQTRRMYGTFGYDADGNLTSLADDGKVSYEIELLSKESTNKTKEGALLDSKLNESYAAIHKVVADTYVNHGSWSYSLSASGLTSAPTESTSVSFNTLSEAQKTIAQEQAKGYAYNAWANALTGTSSMLGTAIASELSEFNPGGTGYNLLTSATGLTDKLAGIVEPSF